jgi:hypothetical protein
MLPKKIEHDPQNRLFQNRLILIIDTEHPLAKLADRINWSSFEKKLGEIYIAD